MYNKDKDKSRPPSVTEFDTFYQLTLPLVVKANEKRRLETGQLRRNTTFKRNERQRTSTAKRKSDIDQYTNSNDSIILYTLLIL
jgi:hypothetical protein